MKKIIQKAQFLSIFEQEKINIALLKLLSRFMQRILSYNPSRYFISRVMNFAFE